METEPAELEKRAREVSPPSQFIFDFKQRADFMLQYKTVLNSMLQSELPSAEPGQTGPHSKRNDHRCVRRQQAVRLQRPSSFVASERP